jgi:ABC-2 type transport system permease protein
MVTLPVVLGLAAVAMSSILPVPLAKVAEMLLAALPLLLLGMLVNFLLGLGISYLAFWMDEVWTLHVVKDISLWFLSGQLLPLSLLPSTAAQISALLPFQHLAYTPAGIMAELIPVSALPGLLAHALLWCGLLSCAVAALWRAGIRRYGAYGG